MWRFVQISDPHLGSHVDGEWNNRFLCTMMPDVMRCLRRDLGSVRPEFILATGDICSHQTRDAMFAARDLMDSLGFPYYPMGGNHDFVLPESRDWFLEAFEPHLPVYDTSYTFVHKNLRFYVLDAWWKWSDGSLCPFSEKSVAMNLNKTLDAARWAIPPNQFAWLEDELMNNPPMPSIVALHYPAIPIPERLRRPELRDAGHLQNGALLMEVLKQFPQVKAIFCGHVHMHFIEPDDGITHVVTGSLPEFPTEYRDIQVYDDHMEIFTMPLSDLTFANRSLIQGKDWTASNGNDRRAIISLV